MKIAVTYENGSVFQHFGHTESFKIYEIEDDTILAAAIVSAEGSGHGALAGLLAANEVDALLCGGIGAGAKRALADAGISLYGGVSGDADQAIADLISGDLKYDSDSECAHNHDHGDHDCGSHGSTCSDHECDVEDCAHRA